MIYKYGSYGYIAHKDLARANIALASESYEMAGQYCQQCLEKIFKEYIQENSIGEDLSGVLKSHNLRKLANQASIESIKPYSAILAKISGYYYETRYPGVDYCELDQEDAVEAVQTTKEIVNIIDSLMKPKEDEQD